MSAVVSHPPAANLGAKHLRPGTVARVPARLLVPGEISQVVLVADDEDEIDTSLLEHEFPSIGVERTVRHDGGGSRDLVIDDFAWRGAFDFARFDEMTDQARPIQRLVVRGSDAVGVATEVLARYQRLLLRRNTASATLLFDTALEAHTWLFDASIPLAQHDLAHALDTWQWLLRIDPDASLAVQLAALFHGVERLETDPVERLEHRSHRASVDTAPPSGVHVQLDGERVLGLVRSIGFEESVATRVRDLVAGRAQGPDTSLLDDADGLSFLSLMSPRYADHFGLAQTRRKVTFTLGRLGPVARSKVALIRLRPDVDRLLQQG